MSDFSRKHYEIIANQIKAAMTFCETDNQRRGVERLRNQLALMFTLDSGRFDRNRFIAACQPPLRKKEAA